MNEYEHFKKWVNSFGVKIYYKLKPPTKKELYEIIIRQEEEIERLNNNWNELEKYTKKEIKKWKEEEKTENDYSARANILGYITGMENIQDKIKELKGDDKE